MTYSELARTAPLRRGSLTSSTSPVGPITDITIYGCAPDEAALFKELSPRFGVHPIMTEAPLSEHNVAMASGGRCVSIDHKTPVTNTTLLALSRVGVKYVSTRSIGTNHIDVSYAESLGLTVGTVVYSPDSVADFTLMLILMAIRSAKSIIRRTASQDFRLNDVRGKELRDLTVGIVGAGRIGSAVMDRLRGFGCVVLATDPRPHAGGNYLPLDELLRRSDIVSLHTPLSDETHHLLDAHRIARMRRGAFVINTGRGGLIDTEALVVALESGKVGGAALDVLEGEEGIFYTDHRGKAAPHDWLLRLQRLPNVVISPHTAYYTDHALCDTVENSLINCLVFEGRESAWTA